MGAWRRLLVAVLAGLALASPASAGTGLFVGLDEDAVKWGRSQLTSSVAQALGVSAVRITIPWQPGQSRVPGDYRQLLDRVVAGTWGLRLVVSVYGSADQAPRTEVARAQYCDFVADLLRAQPTIADVVIWNDPNDGAFWSPQLNPDSTSAAPAAYEALLARCWDAAHSVRPAANVIGLTVSKGASDPTALTASWHDPVTWYRKVGAAYRASGRRLPILDTVGHIPHPDGSAERPWTRHPGSGAIGEGDYDKLTKALADAFGGTAQPLPGQGPVTVWYLAQGFQTTADPGKAHLYTGGENDRSPLPAWSAAAAADTGEGPAPDQATQLADAVRVAYCQPNVAAYFNFLLADEPGLGGWQSGILWADWSPKPSYSAFRRVVGEVRANAIDCAAFSATGAPPRPVPTAATVELRISGFRATSVSPFSAAVAWQTTAPARARIAYGLPGSAPTLWATPAGSSATLSGLAFATAYRVRLTAVSDDGQRAQAELDLSTPGLPRSPVASIQRPAGVVLLDGQPFFPLMVWNQCPAGYGASLAAGINLFAANPCGGLTAQLDALAGRALSAAAAGDGGAGGAGLIGFFHPDEPEESGITAESLPPAPAGAPPFSFLTLTNHFYSGAAPMPQGRGMYAGLIARADAVGFDLYPLQEWCRPERLADVYAAQQELVRLAAQKPTFQWIEASEWKCPGGRTAVTPATVRAESWLAIAGGAHGLGFFPATWPPSSGRAIAGVARDVARLGPALLAAPVPASADNAHVKVGARSLEGALYVIAVNASTTPVRATLRVAGLGGRALDVLDESRRVGASGGAFTDTLAPLAVRVYIAPPPDAA